MSRRFDAGFFLPATQLTQVAHAADPVKIGVLLKQA
jgi:hypothetical protein